MRRPAGNSRCSRWHHLHSRSLHPRMLRALHATNQTDGCMDSAKSPRACAPTPNAAADDRNASKAARYSRTGAHQIGRPRSLAQGPLSLARHSNFQSGAKQSCRKTPRSRGIRSCQRCPTRVPSRLAEGHRSIPSPRRDRRTFFQFEIFPRSEPKHVEQRGADCIPLLFGEGRDEWSDVLAFNDSDPLGFQHAR